MKKLLFLFAVLMISASAFGQIAYLQYRHVPGDQIDKFVELETTHWSKVAKSAIDKGQMSSWSLWQKVGVTTDDAPNFVFVNTFENLDQMDNNIWGDNMEALGDVKAEDIETGSFTTTTFDYYTQVEDLIEGDYKYAIVNYAKPTDRAAFVAENKTLWKPLHEASIANTEDGNGMTAWGISTVVYPTGNQARFSVMTWDGFNKMSDVMNYLRYVETDAAAMGPFQEVIAKSKMNDIVPEGFEYRIIYERVMTVE